jgi:hypothetical protein
MFNIKRAVFHIYLGREQFRKDKLYWQTCDPEVAIWKQICKKINRIGIF